MKGEGKGGGVSVGAREGEVLGGLEGDGYLFDGAVGEFHVHLDVHTRLQAPDARTLLRESENHVGRRHPQLACERITQAVLSRLGVIQRH